MPATPSPRSVHVDAESGYRLWARHYEEHANPMLDMVAGALDELLPDLRGACVAELGCGTGLNLARIAQRAPAALFGLDISREMLQRARGRLDTCAERVQLVRCDLRRPLPLSAGRFDVLLIALALEHLPEPRPLFERARALLVPGGRLLLAEIHPELRARGKQAHFDDPASGREYLLESHPHTRAGLVRDIEAAGLTLEQTRDWLASAEQVRRNPKLGRHDSCPLLFTLVAGTEPRSPPPPPRPHGRA